MGHRANYVILNGGEPELYASGWGALSLMSDIFYGPEVTAAFMRSHQQCERLMDEVWCEGAALLDLIRQRLLFFSDFGLRHPLIVRHYLGLLQRTYPAWEVHEATDGIRDICAAARRDVAEVIAEDLLDEDDRRELALEADQKQEPEALTDSEAIAQIEKTLLSADQESEELGQWLQHSFTDRGMPLTPLASTLVQPIGNERAKARFIQTQVATYRASLSLG